MADFNDITGWEEELSIFESTDEGQDYFREFDPETGVVQPVVKITMDVLFELTEFITSFEAINHEFRKYAAWQKQIDDQAGIAEGAAMQQPGRRQLIGRGHSPGNAGRAHHRTSRP